MKTVLILGSGQLSQMMTLASAPLNIRVLEFDVNTMTLQHPLSKVVIDDSEHSLESAISQCDFITCEFEHVPESILARCEKTLKLFPSRNAIQIGGDRRLEKRLLDECKIPNAPYKIVNNEHEFMQSIHDFNADLIIKTALGGYDGKGQWRYNIGDNLNTLWADIEPHLKGNQALVLEQKIKFESELSIIGTRDSSGNVSTYSLTKNSHVDGILTLSTNMINHPLQEKAHEHFKRLTDGLNYIGTFAIEFFLVNGDLLVNEVAPRVHNSGHWTQAGAHICQFENHMRAICNIPLGSTKTHQPTTMINLLGVDAIDPKIYSMDGVHVNWYGKEKRAGRKMGHINITGDNPSQLDEILSLLK